MRFFTVFTTVVLPLVSAAPLTSAPVDNPVVNTMQYLSGQLGILVNSVNAYTGDPAAHDRILAQSQDTLQTLSQVIDQLIATPHFTPFNAVVYTPAAAKIDYQVHQLTNALEAKKPIIDSLGQTAQFAQLLEQEYVGSSQLTQAFKLKMPAFYWAVAAPGIVEIPQRIAQSMNNFKGFAPNADVPAVSLSPEQLAKSAAIDQAAWGYGPAPIAQAPALVAPAVNALAPGAPVPAPIVAAPVPAAPIAPAAAAPGISWTAAPAPRLSLPRFPFPRLPMWRPQPAAPLAPAPLTPAAVAAPTPVTPVAAVVGTVGPVVA